MGVATGVMNSPIISSCVFTKNPSFRWANWNYNRLYIIRQNKMTHPFADFPIYRPRRLRRTSWMRELVAQTRLHPSDLIWPIFICEGTDCAEPIAAMPNVSRLSVDRAVIAAQKAADVGIPLIALFPNTPQALRTPDCAEAYNPNNLVNRAARAIKSAGIAIGIMTDVALDPYNSDGHDGLLRD